MARSKPAPEKPKKSKGSSRKKSDAWKAFERQVTQNFREAGFARAFRVLRGDDIGISDIDVEIPEVPQAKIDCKYKVGGWTHLSIFEECEKKYVKEPGDFLILPTKAGRKEGSISAVRTEVLAELLAKLYIREDKPQGVMGCPWCPGGMRVTDLNLGLSQCVCAECGYTLLAPTNTIPEAAKAYDPQPGMVVLPDYPLELESAPIEQTRKSRKKSA